MQKISENDLKEYVSEVGEFEKEHRRGSSFYVTATHTFTSEDIAELAEEGIDASGFLNVCVTMTGTWEDDWGTQWDEIHYRKVEEYQQLVPEKVIPAHYVTKRKTEVFVPAWE